MVGQVTAEELTWLIAAAVGVIGVIGGIVARDRYIIRSMADGDEKLHERINRVREDYVRRDDLDGHIARLEKEVSGLKDDQRASSAALMARLDSLFELIVKAQKVSNENFK